MSQESKGDFQPFISNKNAMKYLLVIVFMLSLEACQNPQVETLEAEKAGLVKLWEEEVTKTAEADQHAVEAEDRVIIVLEDAE